MLPSLGLLHLTFVFGLCAGLTYLLALALAGPRLLRSRELGIVVVLTIWYIAGIPFALWRGGSLYTLLHVWLKTLFVFFLLTQTLVTLHRVRRLLWAIILSELVITSISIVQPSKVIWVGERMLGVNQGILGWNFLGIAAAVTIPFIAAIFLARQSLLQKSLLIAAFGCMMWMLMLTASRGGILSVLFSVTLTWLLILRRSSYGRILGTGIVLGLILVISLAPAVFWQRLSTVWDDPEMSANRVEASAEESKQDHLFALTQSVQYTLDNPIFGLGLGNFDVASGMELGRWMGTHNTFTQVSSEAGLPALLLFISLPITALLRLKRIKHAFSGESAELFLMINATMASLLAFAFGACFAHLAYEYYFFYPLAIAVALQHIGKRISASPLTHTGN